MRPDIRVSKVYIDEVYAEKNYIEDKVEKPGAESSRLFELCAPSSCFPTVKSVHFFTYTMLRIYILHISSILDNKYKLTCC